MAKESPRKRRSRRSRVNDAKRFKQNRGQGERGSYIPWIWVTDFSPHSLKRRIPGVKIHRLYHVLSQLEARVFYILESMPGVVDIREQFPLLPLIETVEIARAKKIRHPKFNGIPTVRTTDFLVATESSTKAYSVKYRNALTKRNLELIEIEREYWKRRGIKFVVVLETSITRPQYKNAKRIRQFSKRPACKIKDVQMIESLTEMAHPTLKTKQALRIIANKFNERFMNVHHLFLHLLFTRQISLDLRKVFAIDSTTTDLCFQNRI